MKSPISIEILSWDSVPIPPGVAVTKNSLLTLDT